MLFVILVTTVVLQAKDSPAFATTVSEKLQGACCACTSSFSGRRATLIVCGVLAILTMALAVASDDIPCDPNFIFVGDTPSNQAGKFRLAAAAFGFQSLGGAIMYCFSSCGCTLCCACAPGACNRTVQATTAIGCSILMWWISGILFVWIVSWLSIDLALSVQSNSNYGGSYRESDDLPCFYTFYYVPSGLTSIAGILSASSLVLQGHFITLVPEALHNLYPPMQAQQTPASEPTQVQPPQVVNNQPASIHPEPTYLAVAAPIEVPVPYAIPAAADA
jgi:hypothetical protein